MFWQRLILTILSAILVFLALPGFIEIPFLIWVALVPLLFALSSASMFEAIFLGFVFGLIHYGAGMWWLLNFNDYPWLTFGFAAIFSGLVHFPIFSALVVFFRKKLSYFLYPINFAFLWIISDYLIREKAFSLPHLNIAESQYNFDALIQIADIGGIYLITLLLILVNVSFFILIKKLVVQFGRSTELHNYKNQENKKWERKLEWGIVTFSVFLIILSLLYGSWQLSKDWSWQNNEKTKLLLIQPSFERDKPQEMDTAYRLEKLIKLTEDNLASIESDSIPIESDSTKLDLIIWPEVVINSFVFYEESPNNLKELDLEKASKIKSLVKENQIPLLFGTYLKPPGGLYYNSVILLLPDGKYQWYNKLKPLFGAEYFPDFLGPIKRFAQDRGFAEKKPGKKATVFSLNTSTRLSARFPVLLCSENGLLDLSKNYTQNGVQFILNASENSALKNQSEIHQQAILSKFRAIENRIYVVGAGNVGPTVKISPSGKISDKLGYYREEALMTEVPLRENQPKTLFTRFGNLIIWLFSAVILSEMVHLMYWKRKKIA